ncbi:hypothetical protein JL09_g6948, partial [Pichia kudriavzevii]
IVAIEVLLGIMD